MPITPHLCGRETEIRSAMAAGGSYWSGQSPLQLDQLRSGFACALHMHQPTIPAGPDGALISHLQYMLEHPGEGDNHNAEPFAHCYRRLADLIPQLTEQGIVRTAAFNLTDISLLLKLIAVSHMGQHRRHAEQPAGHRNRSGGAAKRRRGHGVNSNVIMLSSSELDSKNHRIAFMI